MPNDDNWMRNYTRYSTIAFQMIIIVLGGVFLGFKIDQWLHLEKHIFLVILSILSGFLALYLAFRDLLKFK
jgi:hypothetical protein